jgi:hypothetical protein
MKTTHHKSEEGAANMTASGEVCLPSESLDNLELRTLFATDTEEEQAVKPAWAKQRWLQQVRPIRRANHEHIAAATTS